MTEQEFLAGYRPEAFDRPAVTVDLVLMTASEGSLQLLLAKRLEHPHRGRWSLPGGFVGVDEDLERAARRVLRQKACLETAFLEQLATFGAVDRDPRMRVITIAYFALLPPAAFDDALGATNGLVLATIRGADGDGVDIRAAGKKLSLAFDHPMIVAQAVARLRGKLDYSDVAYALLPAEFTLRQLQEVHETILGRPLNKPAFRKRMLDKGVLRATGRREQGLSFRPAELYRYIGAPAGSAD